jgi:esterase
VPADLSTTLVAADARTPAHAAILLHGIYGRGRNWTSVAKQTAAKRPDWGFWLTDLRLHGASPPQPPPHTVAACARDVVALATRLSGDAAPVRAILGHSFGGKVALASAQALAEGADETGLDHVWVIDSTPEAREPGGSAWDMLAIVRSLPARFAARADAIAAMEARDLSPGVAAWMATNLRFEDGGFVWVLDFDALEALLRDFFVTDLWPVVEQPPGHVTIHFVKAEESSTLSESACARIATLEREAGRVHLHRVAGGHWVNSENPAAIVDLLSRELPTDSPSERQA